MREQIGERPRREGGPADRADESVAPIDLDRLNLDAFRGRPVAVLGLARSGTALARFLSARGAIVTAYDVRPLAELSAALDSLEGRPIRLLAGPEIDPAEALRGQALITTSPSVSSRFPTTEPRLRGALADVEEQATVPIVSEVDLFLRLCPAVTIGVTGTKGKTTTSSLIAAVLRRGEAPVLLGGNIGAPLVERLPELTPEHRVVLELSELQLPTLSRGTHVAVYTHVTQDHLDRHGSVESYRAVKRRLAELVDPVGAVVLNAEDPETLAYTDIGRGRSVLYRRDTPLPGGVGIAFGWVVSAGIEALGVAVRRGDDQRPGDQGTGAEASPQILPVSDIPLPGAHNVSNVLAAVAVGLLFGVSAPGIREAVASFEGVPHRLETVADVNGVRFVNDSQGTQPDAVIAALLSFEQPLVLIAGGREKRVPLDELAQVARERVTAIVLIGESAALFEAAFGAAGHDHVERTDSLEAAVERAYAIAREAGGRSARDAGDVSATVLLSPAAASFDMFIDYAARGEAFRAAVAALAARERAQ